MTYLPPDAHGRRFADGPPEYSVEKTDVDCWRAVAINWYLRGADKDFTVTALDGEVFPSEEEALQHVREKYEVTLP